MNIFGCIVSTIQKMTEYILILMMSITFAGDDYVFQFELFADVTACNIVSKYFELVFVPTDTLKITAQCIEQYKIYAM